MRVKHQAQGKFYTIECPEGTRLVRRPQQPANDHLVVPLNGKEVRIPKADVEDRRTSLLSPMPANFNETIKEEDFHHLMAFLLQQRGKDK